MKAAAMKTAISRHPALLTTFAWNEDYQVVQSYHPEVLEDIHVEHLSEFEFEFVRDTAVYPFKIIGGKLFRCRVFETEEAGYVFFDVHHSVFDGTSLKLFMADVAKAYMGMDGDPDYYYSMLKQREDAVGTEFYEESRRYFEERYDGVNWSSLPKLDHESRDNEFGELLAPLDISQAAMTAMEKMYKISRNEFFITVTALAISIYNNAPDVKISWIYNGRENTQNMSTVGLLFRDLPVALRFDDERTLRDVFNDVHEQVQMGIEHSCYPYVESQTNIIEGECAYLLYQRDIRDMDGMDTINVEMVDVRQNQAASQTVLDLEVLDGEEGLELMIDFAASLYEEASIERFKDIFVKLAHTMLHYTVQWDVTIGRVKYKMEDHSYLSRIIKGIFRRKK